MGLHRPNVLNEMPGYKFSDQDLFDAYAIAGTRFGNEIGHHFVILDMKTAMEMSKKKRNKKQKKKSRLEISGSDSEHRNRIT